jgi:hypothetical protein
VWQWKEEVAQEIKGMTSQERIACFRHPEQRLTEKTGKELEAPHGTRRRK